jgi:tetratricopeptide (TPR) repeat protein
LKSGFVAALFAIHPLHVESVAWLPERKDVLSTLFGMFALLAYVNYAQGRRVLGGRRAEQGGGVRRASGWYALSLAAYMCSLLSKQMLVTLPFLMLLLDYWPLGRFRDRAAGAAGQADGTQSSRSVLWLIVEKAPFILAAVLFSAAAFFVQQQGGAVRTFEHFPLSIRIANALLVAVLYIVRMFWPRGLAIYYPHPGAAISYAEAAGAGVLLLAVTIAAVRFARRNPYLPVGWFWYLGSLVPVIGLVQIGTQQMADRYTYVPLIGLFIAVTWLAPSLLPAGRGMQAILATLAIGVVAAFSVLAWRQTALFRDSVTLFQHALDVTGENAVARLNLGKALFDRGDTYGALEQFQAALKLAGDSAAVHGNLGVTLHRLGRHDEAARHLEEAVRLDRGSATAHLNLANLRRDQGQLDAAADGYRQALEIEPKSVAAMNGLADVLSASGKYEAALAQLTVALRLDPDNERTLIGFGVVLNQLGRIDESIRYLRRAVYAAPASTAAQYNLGAALYAAKNYDEAAHRFEEALRLEPEHREARGGLASTLLNLGSISVGQGRLQAAFEHFSRAHELAPGDWRTSYNLGAALAIQGDVPAAIRLFESAVALKPESAEARYQLGVSLLSANRRSEAAEQLREAIKLRPDFREAQAALEKALEKP